MEQLIAARTVTRIFFGRICWALTLAPVCDRLFDGIGMPSGGCLVISGGLFTRSDSVSRHRRCRCDSHSLLTSYRRFDRGSLLTSNRGFDGHSLFTNDRWCDGHNLLTSCSRFGSDSLFTGPLWFESGGLFTSCPWFDDSDLPTRRWLRSLSSANPFAIPPRLITTAGLAVLGRSIPALRLPRTPPAFGFATEGTAIPSLRTCRRKWLLASFEQAEPLPRLAGP